MNTISKSSPRAMKVIILFSFYTFLNSIKIGRFYFRLETLPYLHCFEAFISHHVQSPKVDTRKVLLHPVFACRWTVEDHIPSPPLEFGCGRQTCILAMWSVAHFSKIHFNLLQSQGVSRSCFPVSLSPCFPNGIPSGFC